MKRSGVAIMALAIASAPAPAAFAQGDSSSRVATPSLPRLLAASRLDVRGVEGLYRQAVSRNDLPALEAQVAVVAARSDASPAARARALLIGALLAWQDGRTDVAAASVDAALALDVGIDAQLLRARLFDAIGRPALAAPFYAAAASSGSEDRADLLLRAAIAAAEDGDPKTLAPLAAQAEARTRRGIADLLGVLGDPAGALATYRPVAAGVPAFSAQLRMAQWAIAAGDRDTATAAAWAAFRVATTPADRRYALALLAEAFRNANDLSALLTFLQGKPANLDVLQLRVDTLVELGRMDDALAMLRGSADPALRAQLSGVLDLAGRREALVAEYERLIASDRAALRWYDVLAVLYLSTGEHDRAIGVFRRLFAANPDNLALLTDAARRMIEMGLTDAGFTLLRQSGVGRTTAIRIFQFESDAAQGRTEAAAAVLADLDRRLPPRDAQRIAVADGYERLGRGGDAMRVLIALERSGHVLGFDEQLHLARLERENGRDAAALDRLLDLWFVTDLPAQRGFVETQIVATARRLDRVDDVSDRVRARIVAADDRGVELLVVLRIARNDPAGAAAAVTAFAGTAAASPARMRRLAALYRQLGDRERYRETLMRLADIDPVNAANYLQQLVREVAILPNRGEAVPVAAAELEALLAKLSAARRSDPAEARRFAAAVYGAAGQTDRAIMLYRQAAASSPTDRDAMLGLVNLLNGAGRRAQAIGLLQYRAEFAATPADQAQALEALAGVLAATTGGAEAEQSLNYAALRLLWARRRLYWRLARGADTAALYDQLADISEQIGDTRTQRRVREASLAIEGTQRAATLRQLIALSSGGANGSAGASVGDNDAKALYGRRLTALRQPYPADVYTELAAAMLTQRDLAGAERAFGLIEGIPGLVNVDALRADAYLASGYLQRALAGYSRALLRDRGDDGLILKTAILQEQVGDPASARDLYWQSLRNAVLRVPVAVAPAAPDVPSPFEESLIEGLLFVWPTDPAARNAITTEIEALAHDAVAGTAPVAWGRAARARRVLTVARRLAASDRDRTVLAVIDPLIAARFGDDTEYVRERAMFRDMTGELPVPPANGSADPIETALRRQAGDGTNAELRLALALERDDDTELAELFDAAARAEVATRGALGPNDFVYPSALNVMLTMVAGQLSADRQQAVVLAPLDRAGNRETALFDLYRTAPARLALMDRAAGASLLSDDRLITLIRTRFNEPTPRRVTLRRRTGQPPDVYADMIARFPLDKQVTLYAGLAEDAQRTGNDPVLLAPLEQRILHQALSTGQQARMTTAFRQVMGREAIIAQRVQRLFALSDVPVSNRPVVVAGAQALAERSPEDRGVADALIAYLHGDRPAALEALLRLGETPEGSEYAPGIIAGFLAEDYRRAGAAFLDIADPDVPSRAQFYRRYVRVIPSAFGGTDADLRRYLERLTALDPDNAVYLAALLHRLWSDNDRIGFVSRLAAFVAAHPDERDAAAVLQLAQALVGQSEAAAAVAARTRVDVNDTDTLIELLARVQAASGGGGGAPAFLTLLGYVYGAARQEQPTLRGVAAVEARRRQDRTVVQPAASDVLDPLVRAAANPASVPATMRGVWRRSAANPETPDDMAAVTRTLLLDRLTEIGLSGNSPGKPVDDAAAAALTGSAAIVAELEQEARLLDPMTRQQQQPFYDLIAAGAARQGTEDARIDTLLATLDSGGIGAHDLQLLATLAVRSGRVLQPTHLAAVRTAIDRIPAMSARQRILWSQLFARAGDVAAARRWLEAAVMQILYIDVAELAGGARLATFDTVVESLRRWPDRAAATATHAALAGRIERERAIMPPDDVPDPLPPLVPAS